MGNRTLRFGFRIDILERLGAVRRALLHIPRHIAELFFNGGARLIREKNRVKEFKIGMERDFVVIRSAPKCVLRINCALSDAGPLVLRRAIPPKPG